MAKPNISKMVSGILKRKLINLMWKELKNDKWFTFWAFVTALWFMIAMYSSFGVILSLIAWDIHGFKRFLLAAVISVPTFIALIKQIV